MKKSIFTLAASLTLALSFGGFAQTNTAQAASYGKVGEVTTPARMRGTWSYQIKNKKGHKTTRHVKITKHEVNGNKLYQENRKKAKKSNSSKAKRQTRRWTSASIYDENGYKWIGTRNWANQPKYSVNYGIPAKGKAKKLVIKRNGKTYYAHKIKKTNKKHSPNYHHTANFRHYERQRKFR